MKCPASYADCRCNQWTHEDSVHTCDCGGTWKDNGTEFPEIILFPLGLTLDEVIEDIFGSW